MYAIPTMVRSSGLPRRCPATGLAMVDPDKRAMASENESAAGKNGLAELLKTVSVLVVEDDADVREQLSRFLPTSPSTSRRRNMFAT